MLSASRQKIQVIHGEVKKVQKKLYDSTKTVKVTDDDYSTIQAKLAQMSGKISSLPIQIKSNLKLQNVYSYFYQKWPEESDSLDMLIASNKVDYALISLLVEKLVIEYIVHQIFEAKIHLNFQVNDAFSNIEQIFLKANNAHWIPDLKLKCSKATYDIAGGNGSLVEEINKAKTKLVEDLTLELLNIYNDHQDIRVRLSKIIDMASDLSLPIHGQEDPLIIRFLRKNDKIILNQVKAHYRCVGNENIILGVSPVFLAKTTLDENKDENEENIESYVENCTVIFSGKAIW